MKLADVTIKRIPWGHPEFPLARSAELQVFGVSNNYASADDLRAGQMLAYAPYESHSEFHVATVEDGDDQIMGLMRYLRHDPKKGHDSFTTYVDFREWRRSDGSVENLLDPQWQRYLEKHSPEQIAELATQAVLPVWRKQGVVPQLWLSFDSICRLEGVRLWTMALVLPLFEVYRAMFPGAVQAIGRVMPDYVGADSIPALIKLDHPETEAMRQFVMGHLHRG